MEWKTSVWLSVKYTNEHQPIKVQAAFDFSQLTDEQRLEWLVNGQSPRVYAQGVWRRLSETEFNALANTTQTLVMKPTGTRGIVTMSDHQMLVRMFGEDDALDLIETFGTAANAVAAIKKNKDNMK